MQEISIIPFVRAVVLVVLLFECLSGAPALDRGAFKAKTPTAAGPVFRPEDFVFVINTDQERLQLALASRPLRSGIRTFIAIDNITLAATLNIEGAQHNETYAFFPNRHVSGPERDKPGDTRWQAAPFLAHRHYGPTYKWMLLGDDDTLWFLMGLKRLLYDYDHTLPYAISDHMGDHNPNGFFVPSPLAAVCSPCHWPQLLRAAGREGLMAHCRSEVSEREAAEWDPTALDGWGRGRGRVGTWGLTRKDGNGGTGGEGGGGRGMGEGMGGLARGMRLGRGQGRWRTGQGGGGGGQGLRRPLADSEGRGLREQYPEDSQHIHPAEAQLQLLQQQQLHNGHPGETWPGWEHWHRVRYQEVQQPQDNTLNPTTTPIKTNAVSLEYTRLRARTKRTNLLDMDSMTALLHLAYYGTDPTNTTTNTTTPDSTSPAHSSSSPLTTGPPSPLPPPGCPCRPATGCLHRARLCRGKDRGQQLCGRSLVFKTSGFRGNRTTCRHSWGHGGAGVVLSVGLMEAVVGGPAEVCALNTHLHSCDMNLAMCLMKAGGGGAGGEVGGGGGGLEGFMFTHPGSAVLHGANWADPRFILFDNPVFPAVVRQPLGFLAGTVQCSGDARGEITRAVAELALASAEEGEGEEGEGEEGLEGEEDEDKEAVQEASAEGANPGLKTGEGKEVDRAGGGQAGGGGAGRLLVEEEESSSIGSRGGTSAGDGGGDQAICEWLVRHAVSVHMHGRSFPSYEKAAEAMTAVVRQHLIFIKVLRDRWQQQQQQRLRPGSA